MTDPREAGLIAALAGDPHAAYAYAYPHKTAYRPLDPPVPLDALWRAERRDALFLYIHVPFCGMRCGFCNLFTLAKPDPDLPAAYVAAVERQAAVLDGLLGERRFARLAIGGGTPTHLEAPLLDRLFGLARRLGCDALAAPASVELSPETALPERLAVLADHGVRRVSLGVQSFDDGDLRALARPQQSDTVLAAVERLRAHRFPVLNLDLIYGAAGQTPQSWLATLESALALAPEELYLYPLYSRPKTGLAKRGRGDGAARIELYRLGRDRLLAAGYVQHSQRLFRRGDAPDEAGPAYRCQEDGMIGLGAGARSYASALHYSTDWAVGKAAVAGIIADFIARDDARHASADYGVRIGPRDARTRHVLQSVLMREGLDGDRYRAVFGSAPDDDFRELALMEKHGLLARDTAGWRPTDLGLERGDAIAPWLTDPQLAARMEGFALR